MRARLRAHEGGRVGVGHRLGGERRVDDQQPEVVLGELPQPELGQDEDAEADALVDHRRQQHRLVDVGLGARDRDRARVVGGVVDELRDAVLRDPAGDALADLDAQVLDGLVGVHGAVAHHRDRDQVLALDPVDAHVVVVDELAQLGRDRVADLAHLGQPRQPRPRAAGSTGAAPPRSPSARTSAPSGRRSRRRRRAPRRCRGRPGASGAAGRGRGRASRGSRGRRRAGRRAACRRPPGPPPPAAGCPTAGCPARQQDHRAARRELALAEAVDLEGTRRVEEAVGEARAAGRRHPALGVVEHDRRPGPPRTAPGRGRSGRGRRRRRRAGRRGPWRPAAGPRRGAAGALDCSVAFAPWISTPSVRAIARASRWPSSRPSSTAPAMTSTPHGRSPPGMRTTSSSVPMPSTGAGPSPPGPRVDRLARLERLGEQAAARRHVAARGDARPLDVRRARDEATRPELPDPDQGGAGRDAHPVARLVQRGVHAARERGDLGEVGQQVDARPRTR